MCLVVCYSTGKQLCSEILKKLDLPTALSHGFPQGWKGKAHPHFPAWGISYRGIIWSPVLTHDFCRYKKNANLGSENVIILPPSHPLQTHTYINCILHPVFFCSIRNELFLRRQDRVCSLSQWAGALSAHGAQLSSKVPLSSFSVVFQPDLTLLLLLP